MSANLIRPAQPGDSIAVVDTPALLLDLDVFEHNLGALRSSLQQNTNIKIRSHAKAHKCPSIAHIQRAQGDVGVCVQKARIYRHCRLEDWK